MVFTLLVLVLVGCHKPSEPRYTDIYFTATNLTSNEPMDSLMVEVDGKYLTLENGLGHMSYEGYYYYNSHIRTHNYDDLKYQLLEDSSDLYVYHDQINYVDLKFIEIGTGDLQFTHQNMSPYSSSDQFSFQFTPTDPNVLAMNHPNFNTFYFNGTSFITNTYELPAGNYNVSWGVTRGNGNSYSGSDSFVIQKDSITDVTIQY